MRDTGTWAIIGTFLLAVAAPFMVGWGLFASLAAEDWADDAPGALIGGGLVAALGAIVATIIMLIGRFRPGRLRERWRKAALVIVIISALIGPAWGTGRFLWGVKVGSAGGEGDRAASSSRHPERPQTLTDPPSGGGGAGAMDVSGPRGRV